MELILGMILGAGLGMIFGNLVTVNRYLNIKLEQKERTEYRKYRKEKKEEDFLDRVC